ncbi:hypothetical protein ZIOFF_052915 [Zingiber officinale]|uniref:Uncharacterized protein n=1 Tax=Zingiber officinale TaxID=94328 RepID=A0A8J5KPJ5_ZINOF|nr:hypothetical protein ZIOFF_052915 [Zingiber officinale]
MTTSNLIDGVVTYIEEMDSADCQLQSMENEAPSWADQWGTGGLDADDSKYKESGKDNKKMEKVKAFASSSFGKAKAAATVGASKAKSSTNTGIKWIKTRYQKKTPK